MLTIPPPSAMVKRKRLWRWGSLCRPRKTLEQTRLDATGTAVVVTNLRDGSYETDGRAYLGLKRDARDIKLAPRPTGASNADRLGELKARSLIGCRLRHG
jgi:hypothetical protein